MSKLSVMVLSMLLLASPAAFSQSGEDAQFMGAVIKEQGVTFAVVIVRPETFNDKAFADKLIDTFEPSFGGIPVILMAQDAKGTPTYYGRTDISNFMANVPLENIPWKTYALKYAQQ